MLQSLVLGLQSSSFPLTYFPTIANTNCFNPFNNAIIFRHVCLPSQMPGDISTLSLDPQFALSYFLLFDAATLSSHAKPPPDAPYDVVPVHMAFVDWIPAICTTRTSRSSHLLISPPLMSPLHLHLFKKSTADRETTVGFIITSLLDKSHLTSAFSSDPWAHEGSAAWRARVVLFIGVALMAGGLAGSLVRPLFFPILFFLDFEKGPTD